MPSSNPVGRLQADLSKMNKALKAEHEAEHGYNVDVVAERKALAGIAAQQQTIIDAFMAPHLDAATQNKLLNQIYALGQTEVRTEDTFTAKLGADKKAISADAAGAKGAKAQALKDLLPAEYKLNLAQTNAYRKELGLKPVTHLIRPPAPKPTNRTYVVQAGDSMGGIASRFGISLSALERANPQVSNPDLINIGQRLTIPGGGALPPPPSGGGRGESTAAMARRYLGINSADLQRSSDLDMDKWPDATVDCANFVSAILEKVGRIPANQHNDSVVGLLSNLNRDGWTEVPLSQAKPGDVVTFDGPNGPNQHVELFNAWVHGQPQYVGSNNINADGTQRISYDDGSWAYRAHIWHNPAA